MGISLYYNLQQDKTKKVDLVEVDIKVRCYMKKFNDVCAYQCKLLSPNVGTKLCKLHSLLHITDNIRLFGSSHNFFGGYMESLLKDFVKMPSKRSRKMIGDRFLLDTTRRWSEINMINDYHQHHVLSGTIKDSSSVSLVSSSSSQRCSNKGDNFSVSKGIFKYEFNEVLNMWTTVMCNKARTTYYKVIHPHHDIGSNEEKAIKDFLKSLSKTDNQYPVVECHYELKIKFNDLTQVTVRCNPNRNNREWFDWVRIHFEEGVGVGIVFLFLTCHYHKTDESNLKKEDTFFLSRTLQRYEENKIGRRYDFLSYFAIDQFHRDRSFILPLSALKGPTVVVTGFQRDRNGSFGDEKYRQNYFIKNRYRHFLNLPHSSGWASIGWDPKEMKDMRDKLQKIMDDKYCPMDEDTSDSDLNDFIDSYDMEI